MMNNQHKGFTLIEFVVAIAIGLISIYAVYYVFYQHERHARQIVSLHNQQQAGTNAMFVMAQIITDAGSNMMQKEVYEELVSCLPFDDMTIPSPSGGQGLLTGIRPVPVAIEPGKTKSNDQADSVVAWVGASSLYGVMWNFSPKLGSGRDTVSTSDLPFPLKTGDVLVGQYDNSFCNAFRVVSANASSATLVSRILDTQSSDAREFDRLINVGHVSRYRFWLDTTSNTLRMDEASMTDTGGWAIQSTPLASNVMLFAARYGIDTDNDQIIDAWEEPDNYWSYNNVRHAGADKADLDADQIKQIQAVQIGMVIASDDPLPQLTPERSAPTELILFANCSDDLASCPPPLHYKIPANVASTEVSYRKYETIIPLRNTIWNSIDAVQ